MTMATTDEITVTHNRSAIPNRNVEPSTSQTRLVRKLTWSLASDGIACVSRQAATRAHENKNKTPPPGGAPAEEAVAEPARAGPVGGAFAVRAVPDRVNGR